MITTLSLGSRKNALCAWLRLPVMFLSARMWLLCCSIPLLTGCASFGIFGTPYTKEASRRADQEWWIKEDLVHILARHMALRSRINPETVDRDLARNVRKVLDICFIHGSYNGKDVDGGVRAMNFFKKAYFKSGGDYWTWREAVRRRRQTLPAPSDREQSISTSAIPDGYR